MIKTCGDCIHADVCKEVNGGWVSPKNPAYCKLFKNKDAPSKWISVEERLPNEEFEEFTEQMDWDVYENQNMPAGPDFGWALNKMRHGWAVRRRGWNGKGIFAKMQVPDEHSKMTSPYIYIDTTGLQTDNTFAPRSCVPWLASQTDMLATDWEIAD